MTKGTIEEVIRNRLTPFNLACTLLEDDGNQQLANQLRENMDAMITASSNVSDCCLGEIAETFEEAFGRTPLTQRLEDIDDECRDLVRWTDMKDLKENAGDLLCSVLMLAHENGWDPSNLVYDTLRKIRRRHEQYRGLGRKMKVAILGGAFDPIHNGHIALAQFVLNTSRTFDEVWLMPANRHMSGKNMQDVKHRLKMCELAAAHDGRIKVSRYEIDNDMAGETYHTMKNILSDQKMTDKYDFSVIIGLDNANHFDKWVNYQHLERMCRFVVVSRIGEESNGADWYLKSPHIYLKAEDEIPGWSSTMIRNGMMVGDDPAEYLAPSVRNYIYEKELYRCQKY